jgi:hypothetical protein
MSTLISMDNLGCILKQQDRWNPLLTTSYISLIHSNKRQSLLLSIKYYNPNSIINTQIY